MVCSLLREHGKAVLNTGQTFDDKRCLKALEGKWNASLKGWTFPERDRQLVCSCLRRLGHVVIEQDLPQRPGIHSVVASTAGHGRERERTPPPRRHEDTEALTPPRLNAQPQQRDIIVSCKRVEPQSVKLSGFRLYELHTKMNITSLHCPFEFLSSAILYYTILHYSTLYYTILHYTIPHYTTLYYTILYYTTLYYTSLHYTTLADKDHSR